jgi:hypothetical protein
MAVALSPSPGTAPPRWTSGDSLLVLGLILLGPLGAFFVLLSGWSWRRKLSSILLWALLLGSATTGQAWVLPAALAALAVYLLVDGEGPKERFLGSAAVTVLMIPILGVAMLPISKGWTTSTSSQAPGCTSLYGGVSILGFAQLPLHAGFCTDGKAVRYEWEDCGPSSVFALPLETCTHQSLPDGSMVFISNYSVAPWSLSYLRRSGSYQLTVTPDGRVTSK